LKDLKKKQQSSGESTPSLRVLCPTRWTVRHASTSNILEEVQDEHDEYAVKASGLFRKIEKFETYL